MAIERPCGIKKSVSGCTCLVFTFVGHDNVRYKHFTAPQMRISILVGVSTYCGLDTRRTLWVLSKVSCDALVFCARLKERKSEYEHSKAVLVHLGIVFGNYQLLHVKSKDIGNMKQCIL